MYIFKKKEPHTNQAGDKYKKIRFFLFDNSVDLVSVIFPQKSPKYHLEYPSSELATTV